MNILSRILFLFRALAVEITIKEFNEWDKILSLYLAGGKNQECGNSRHCNSWKKKVVWLSHIWKIISTQPKSGPYYIYVIKIILQDGRILKIILIKDFPIRAVLSNKQFK